MAITIEVGTNSYITLAEANTILEIYPEYILWGLLTDVEKNNLLVRATRNIENNYYSNKKNYTQKLSFPLYYQSSVLDVIKEAQAIEAISLIDISLIKESGEYKSGLLSEKVREASKTYSDSKANSLTRAIRSDKAYRMLNRFIKKTAPY